MLGFIINLETSQDRREDMIKQMNSLGLTYQIVDAISGEDLVFSEYRDSISKLLEVPVEKLKPTYYLDRRNFISLSDKWESIAPRVGCFLSHMKCLKLALENNLNEVLILEDDVKILGNLDLIPNVDKEIIYLGATVRKLGEWPPSGYYDCLGLELFGTYGYVIKGIGTMLKIYNAMRSTYDDGTRRMKYGISERMSMSNIDNFYRRYFHEDAIVMYPPLVVHRDELPSTISNKPAYKKKYGLKDISLLVPS